MTDDDCPAVDDDFETDVFASDRWTCQFCGRVGEPLFPEYAPEFQDEPVDLEAHHKVPRSEGGTDNIENLITICRECHQRLHHDPAPEATRDDDTILTPTVIEQATGLTDPESPEAEIFITVAQHGPVRTGQVAEAVDLSKEHARRLLYQLGAKDLVVPTRDGGWHITDRVSETPVGELPDTPRVAAIRIRDELLRRATEWGLDDNELAEIADVSPRTVRVAVDRAATYNVPLPDDTNGCAVPSEPDDEQTTLDSTDDDNDEVSPPT